MNSTELVRRARKRAEVDRSWTKLMLELADRVEELSEELGTAEDMLDEVSRIVQGDKMGGIVAAVSTMRRRLDRLEAEMATQTPRRPAPVERTPTEFGS